MTEPNMAASASRGPEFHVTHPVDPNIVLAEQLAQSNEVLRECWRAQRDQKLEMRLQLDVLKIAARLMKINLRQCEALAGRPREFIHRIVIERPLAGAPGPFGETVPETVDVTPPPPAKILKTIPGGEPRLRTP